MSYNHLFLMQSKLDKYYLLTVAINLNLCLPRRSVLRGSKTLKYPTTFASQEHQAKLWPATKTYTNPCKIKTGLGVRRSGRRGHGWGRGIHENMEDYGTEPLPKGSSPHPFPSW